MDVSRSHVDSLPPLSYTPLERPSEQIRLLSRSAPNQWRLTTFDIASAPRYACLSYAWGSSAQKKVAIIDMAAARITRNCWYALNQLARQLDFDYFWIDAICIDQQNFREKGVQVQNMASIFALGATTYISFGRHDLSSPSVFNALKEFKRWLPTTTAGNSPSDDNPHGQVFEWVNLFEHKEYILLVEACDDFAMRTYWKRLWVYQEMKKSTHMQMMSGEDTISWSFYLDLHEALYKSFRARTAKTSSEYEYETAQYYAKSGCIWHLLHLRHVDDPAPKNLLDMLEAVRDCICSDPRDKFYGLISLLPSPGTPSEIKVDYNHTAFQVACDALLHYSTSDYTYTTALAQALAHSMRLEPESVRHELKRVLQSQKRISRTLVTPITITSKFKFMVLRDRPSTAMIVSHDCDTTKSGMQPQLVLRHERDRLERALRSATIGTPFYERVVKKLSYMRTIKDEWDTTKMSAPESRTVLEIAQDKVGWATARVQTGDILLVPAMDPPCNLCLIFRSTATEKYRCVGQTYAVQRRWLPDPSDASDFRSFRVSFHPGELLFWVSLAMYWRAQDVAGGRTSLQQGNDCFMPSADTLTYAVEESGDGKLEMFRLTRLKQPDRKEHAPLAETQTEVSGNKHPGWIHIS